MSYNWFDREDWIPYVGVGFEAEFASNGSDCGDCSSCDRSCDSGCDSDCGSSKTQGDCIKCGLSQWGILVKAGVSF